MTRHIVLGNGELLVNLDKWLQVRDIYYPHVGQENHLMGHAHKLGVFVDGHLSWVNEEKWERTLSYLPNTLVSDCTATNHSQNIRLRMHDCVDCEKPVFLRKIEVANTNAHARDVLIFFHHDFHLYGDGIGDTAGYDFERNSLFHYKRERYFLISASHANRSAHHDMRGDIHEYSVGQADGSTIEDAKDGSLEKKPIAQGAVDSILSVKLHIPAGESRTFYYWILCGKSFKDVHALHSEVMKTNPEEFFFSTKACWEGLLNTVQRDFMDLDQSIVELYKRSILIMRTQIDRNGAIVAANDSDNMLYNKDTYSYVWPRDGALVSIALQKAGYVELTRNFYLFCRDVISEYGCFLHKYNPDKSLGSSWHPWVRDSKFSIPIQEDETGLVLYALWHFYGITNERQFIEELYPTLIKPAADFMVWFRDPHTKLPRESYDLWEERFGTFTYTSTAVYLGLRAAASFARLLNDSHADLYDLAAREMHDAMHDHLYDKGLKRFIRGLVHEKGDVKKDETLDSTLLSLFTLHCCENDAHEANETIAVVKERLWVQTHIGGIARYEGDRYHRQKDTPQSIPGNPWFISTMWLGKWHVHSAKSLDDLEHAKGVMQWALAHALPTGLLPEQLHPLTGEPLSVCPLTWSHAEFVELVCDYLEKRKELTAQ